MLAMAQDRVPLYVRLPLEQAAALDRLVDTTGQRKQQVVSELLADRLAVGRIDIAEAPGGPTGEVLTLDELAQLLRLPADAVEALAKDGELPGRRIAGEWRFARSAVLEWLSAR
jgi:excisionase family DNA binding protein